MATVRVSEIWLERTPAVVPAPRVRISEISLTRTPPAAPPPMVRVSAIWITRGYEPPVVPEGGVRRRVGSTWAEYGTRMRLEGVWQ